jgi:hypothetical protein
MTYQFSDQLHLGSSPYTYASLSTLICHYIIPAHTRTTSSGITIFSAEHKMILVDYVGAFELKFGIRNSILVSPN